MLINKDLCGVGKDEGKKTTTTSKTIVLKHPVMKALENVLVYVIMKCFAVPLASPDVVRKILYLYLKPLIVIDIQF